MTRCSVGTMDRIFMSSLVRHTVRCTEQAIPGESYCPAHKDEAMARVMTVLNDRPKPWGGVVRGSQLRKSHARQPRPAGSA